MAGIHPKTLQDLEFPTVLQQVSARCRTEHGKALALEIAPFTDEEHIREQLGQTEEYLSSFVSENRIPPHSFEGIDKELQLLEIENTVLEVQGFKKISSICTNISTLKSSLKNSRNTIPSYILPSKKLRKIRRFRPWWMPLSTVLGKCGTRLRTNFSLLEGKFSR